MKVTSNLIQFLMFTFICFFINSPIHAQIDITDEEWREDLTYLQNKVHDEYSFLFKKTTKEEFDEKVVKLYSAIPELELHEIIIGFAKLISSFEYGHTSLSLNGDQINFYKLPVNLYHFSDGVFVEGSHIDYKDLLGAKLIAIEGVPIDKVLSLVRPVVPAENDQFFKGYGLGYITIPEVLHAQGVTKELKKNISIKFEKNGKVFTKSVLAQQKLEMPKSFGFVKNEGNWVSSREQSGTPLYLDQNDKNYYFKYLENTKTVYVRYSAVVHDPSEPIPNFYDRVFSFIDENEVEKLILDVRFNGGGDNFNNKTLVTKIIETKKINQAGKFFVIIGRNTFSACQNLINEFDNYTNVIFVGEPSAENINFYGDNRTEVLPNSQLAPRLSWAWWQDKAPWQNADWTVPQFPVELSFNEYIQNQDPVFERALQFSDENFIANPISYLSELFMSRKIELLESEAKRMVGDPNYGFVDFEAEFDKVGYMLLKSKQLEGALYLFQMNASMFPESLRCTYGLAEALLASNQEDKALELYKSIIEKAAESDLGKKASEKVKLIHQK